MTSFLRRAAPALILTVLSLSAGSAFAAFATTQAPCTTAPGWCLRFTGAAVPPVLRSLTFNAPTAGVAVATFHGSLNCVNTGTARATIDLVSQIVDSAAAPALQNGPGGLRHLTLLPPQSLGQNSAATFNLASTRALSVAAAGSKTFTFKLRRVRMDPGTSCYLYNAVFTVVFTP
jgi:hypothetical protein